MSDYIERKAALAICEKEYKERVKMADWCGDTVAWNIAADVSALPAADVAPVGHGEWEFPIFADSDDELDPRVKCSECGNVEAAFARWNYCPNCGAKMDKEDSMSENAEKKENRKLCPFGWAHCAKEVCEWWLEFANSCAIPLTACILADSTICQNVWEREPRWAEQEVKDAKAIQRILPEARDIDRVTETMTVVRDEDGFCLLTLQKDMFPNVKEGQAVKLADIIGGNE